MKKWFRCLVSLLVAVAAVLPALPASAGHLALPEEELRAYEKTVKELPFLTNDGAPMTYGSAVQEICDMVQEHAAAVNPALTAEQRAAMRGLVAKRLYLQQYGTDRRFVGDHGIRHIYGNIGRSLHLLAKKDDATKLAALVAQIYHDISYTDPDILFGEPDEDGEIVYAPKFDHDMRSWDFFTENDLPFWKGLSLFSDGDLAAMENAVALHNADVGEYAKRLDIEPLSPAEKAEVRARLHAYLDVGANPVVAAVHLADKLALSEREKMPIVLSRTPAIMEAVVRAYGVEMMKKAVDKETRREVADALLALATEEAQAGAGAPYIHPSACNERDINPESGKRFIPMNFIQTDGNCLSLREIDGVPHAELVVKVLDYDSGAQILGEEIASRQLSKLFKDLNVEKDEIPALVSQAFAEGAVLPDAHVVIRFQKTAMAETDERNATRQTLLRAAASSPLYRWGLLYREIRAACKVGDAGDLTLWKMRNLMKEIGGVTEKDEARFEEQAALPADERDADALLKAFTKCLKHSALPDKILQFGTEEIKTAA